MSEVADRYRKVAATFTARVREVAADKWDAPTPCEGWVTRDVVRHLAEWVPPLFASTWELPMPNVPSADDDPVAAWAAVDAFCQSCLDNAELSATVRDTPMGSMSFEDAFAMIALSDVLIHTWDLARAAGLDDTLDPDELQRLTAMKDLPGEARGEWFGPVVEVAPDADLQTTILAYSGRHS